MRALDRLHRLQGEIEDGCPHVGEWLRLPADALVTLRPGGGAIPVDLLRVRRAITASSIGAFVHHPALEKQLRALPDGGAMVVGAMTMQLRRWLEDRHADGAEARRGSQRQAPAPAREVPAKDERYGRDELTALRVFAKSRGAAERLNDAPQHLEAYLRDRPYARDAFFRAAVDARSIDELLERAPKVLLSRPGGRAHLTALHEAAQRYVEDRIQLAQEIAEHERRLSDLLARAAPSVLEGLDARLSELQRERGDQAGADARRVHGAEGVHGLQEGPSEVSFEEAPPRLVFVEETERTPLTKQKRRLVLYLEQVLAGAEPKDVPLQAMHRALRAARAFLRDDSSPSHAALLRWAAVPSWTHTLDTLDAALASPTSPSGRSRVSLSWTIRRRAQGFGFSPFICENQAGTVWRQAFPRDLSLARLSERDERIASAADPGPYNPYGQALPPARQARALEALVDHPKVQFEKVGRAVRVARGSLQVSVRPASEASEEHTLRIVFSVGERELSAREIDEGAIDERGLLLCHEAKQGTLTWVRLPSGALTLARALARNPTEFPAESHVELAQRLHRLCELSGEGHTGETDSPLERLEIEMPEAMLGERVDADGRIVVVLAERAAGSFEAALRVRPLVGGPLLLPGAGAARIHALVPTGDGLRSRWTERDLPAERERAERLARECGLEGLEGLEGFERSSMATLTGLERALDLVVALRERANDAVVEWPKQRVEVASTIVRNELKVRVSKLADWFGLEGEVEVDGGSVKLAVLLEAVREGRRYVALGPGRYAEIEAELRARLAAANDHVRKGRNGMEIALTAAPAVADLVTDRASLEAVPSFAAILRAMHEARGRKLAAPKHLRGVLRTYQREGFEWLSRLSTWGAGACLADDMGLGKTLQAIALLETRADQGPAIVVAPTSVCGNWVAEIARFAKKVKAKLYRGDGRASLLNELGKGDVLISSYELVTRDAATLAELRFSTLVVDEAQAAKNAGTLRARALRSLHADFRLALTGTPIENHLGELWSIFRIVSPGLFGSWDSFKERFAIPIERNREDGQRQALSRLVRPFLLRRTKEAVAPELPPLTEVTRVVTPSRAERALYDQVRLATLAQIAGGGDTAQDHIIALAAITRLRRLACNPRLLDEKTEVPSSKLHALLDLVDEIRDSGHRALVFSQFTDHLALVRKELDGRGVPYFYLDGATPGHKRDELVTAFQQGERPLFLISLRAGGTGLNLTAADYVIHLDPWWNPAVEDQASDRAHRIGQTRAVTVVRLVGQHTIEEAVLALHGEKRALADAILDGTEAAGRLSTQELIDLVRAGMSGAKEGSLASDGSSDIDEGDDTFLATDAARGDSSPPSPAVVALRTADIV